MRWLRLPSWIVAYINLIWGGAEEKGIIMQEEEVSQKLDNVIQQQMLILIFFIWDFSPWHRDVLVEFPLIKWLKGTELCQEKKKSSVPDEKHSRPPHFVSLTTHSTKLFKMPRSDWEQSFESLGSAMKQNIFNMAQNSPFQVSCLKWLKIKPPNTGRFGPKAFPR